MSQNPSQSPLALRIRIARARAAASSAPAPSAEPDPASALGDFPSDGTGERTPMMPQQPESRSMLGEGVAAAEGAIRQLAGMTGMAGPQGETFQPTQSPDGSGAVRRGGQWAARTAGGLAPILATGAVGGVPAAAGLMGVQGFGGARERGASIPASAAVGGVNAALGSVPVAGALGTLGRGVVGDILSGAGANVGAGVGSELLTRAGGGTPAPFNIGEAALTGALLPAAGAGVRAVAGRLPVRLPNEPAQTPDLADTINQAFMRGRTLGLRQPGTPAEPGPITPEAPNSYSVNEQGTQTPYRDNAPPPPPQPGEVPVYDPYADVRPSDAPQRPTPQQQPRTVVLADGSIAVEGGNVIPADRMNFADREAIRLGQQGPPTQTAESPVQDTYSLAEGNGYRPPQPPPNGLPVPLTGPEPDNTFPVAGTQPQLPQPSIGLPKRGGVMVRPQGTVADLSSKSPEAVRFIAKQLGVLESGPKSKTALIERINQARAQEQPNAIQEQGPAGVDVRQPSPDGQEVPGGNPEGQGTPGLDRPPGRDTRGTNPPKNAGNRLGQDEAARAQVGNRAGTYNRADIEAKLIAAHEAIVPDFQPPEDTASVPGHFVWPGDKYPGEARDMMESHPELKQLFRLQKNAKGVRPGAQDMLGELRADKYEQYAVEAASGSRSNARLGEAKQFFQNNDVDPELQFLATLHDNLPKTKANLSATTETVKPDALPEGTRFEINGAKFRVETDGEGVKVLVDHDQYPTVRAEAMPGLPVDKGSIEKPRIKGGVRRAATPAAKKPGAMSTTQLRAEADALYSLADQRYQDLNAKDPHSAPKIREQEGFLDHAELARLNEINSVLTERDPTRGASAAAERVRAKREARMRTNAAPEAAPGKEPWQMTRPDIASEATRADQAAAVERTTESSKDKETGKLFRAMGAANDAITEPASRVQSEAPPPTSPVGRTLRMAMSPGAADAFKIKLSGITGRLQGFSLPRMNKVDRPSADAAIELASSREVARASSLRLAREVLGDKYTNRAFDRKLGAVLVEDQLRREGVRSPDQAHTTLVGDGGYFKDEAAYRAAMDDPQIQAALKRDEHIAEPERLHWYQEAQRLDPELPTHPGGLETGIHISLKRRDGAPEPTTRSVRPDAKGNIERASPFARRRTGSGEYDLSYKAMVEHSIASNAPIALLKRFHDQLVESGNAEVSTWKDRPATIKGEKVVGFKMKDGQLVRTEEGASSKPGEYLFVRRTLAPEVAAATRSDAQRMSSSGLSVLADKINGVQLMVGVGDFVTHNTNLFKAMLTAPGVGANTVERIAGAIGGGPRLVGALHSMWSKATGYAKGDPAVLKQYEELSRLGATRSPKQEVADTGLIGKVAGLGGKVIEVADRAARLSLDDAYQSLKRAGLAEDSTQARREFINGNVGQYNKALQGALIRSVRNTGAGPFATAGVTFNRLGIRNATGSPGVKGASMAGALGLRTMKAAVIGGTIGQLAFVQYLLTGDKPIPPGVPTGATWLGKNDEAGNPKYIDILDTMTGIRRGARAMGLAEAADRTAKGQRADADRGVMEAVNQWTRPFAGPAVNAAMIAATGHEAQLKDTAGNLRRAAAVAPPGDPRTLAQTRDNLTAAASSAVSQFVDPTRAPAATLGAGLMQGLKRQAGPFMPRSGLADQAAQDMPEIRDAQKLAAFVDDTRTRAYGLPKSQQLEYLLGQLDRVPDQFKAKAWRDLRTVLKR